MGSCSSAARPQHVPAKASKMQFSSTKVSYANKLVICGQCTGLCNVCHCLRHLAFNPHTQQQKPTPTASTCTKLSHPDRPSVSLGPPHPQLQKHGNCFVPLQPDESASINLLEAAQVNSLPYITCRCLSTAECASS
jgi:hypothetical protein